MEINSELFKSSNFNSPIKEISFQNAEVDSSVIGKVTIPALIILLENELKIQLARYVSWTDYDPCFYTIVKHIDIDICDSEWTNNQRNINIKWEESDKEVLLKDLIGNKVLDIRQTLWSTLINFDKDLFFEVSNNKSSKAYSLIIGIWIDRGKNIAEKLGEIEIN